MMRSALAWLALGITLGVVAPTADAVDAPPALVTLDGGAIAQLCAGCSPRQTRFAVTPVGDFKVARQEQAEQPAVVEASLGNLRDGGLPPLFQAKWELAADGTPLALVIAVDPRVQKPGTYTAILNLQPNSRPRAPRLTVQLVQAAAKLEVPDKLVVTRTVYWPFWVHVDRMALDVREASGVADLTGVHVQARPSSVGTEPITGQLVVGTVAAAAPAGRSFDLPSGGQARLPYALSGDFPLGTATGALRFFAPQLTESVTLNVEIRSGLTRLYVLLAIVLGVLVSWFIKVYLQTAIEVGESRVKADALLDHVQADLNKYDDPPFHEALAPPLRDLLTALEGNDAKDIGDKTTALDAAWRDALQKFAARRVEAQKSLDELRAVVEPSWRVPNRALAILASGKHESERIGVLLAANSAQQAREAAMDVQAALGRDLRDTALDWQHRMGQYLRQLADAQAGIPIEVTAQFKDVLDKTPPELGRITPQTPIAGSAAVLQLVQDWASEFRSGRDLLEQLARRLEQAWTELDKTLAPNRATLRSPESIGMLRNELRRFGLTIEAAAADPEHVERVLQAALEALQAAWRDAIVKQLAAPPDQGLEALLTAREFVKAIQQAMQRTPSGEVFLKDQDAAAGDTTRWPAGTMPRTESSLTVLPAAAYALVMPGPLSRLRAESRRRVRIAKGWQSVLIGVLMVVWAFGSYSQSYHGTWADISTIFFGAFGLDLTLDALLSKIRPKVG